MHKTIIKAICCYFAIRNTVLLVTIFAIMGKLTVREVLLQLPGLILWGVPLTILDGLLFGTVYFHLFKRLLKEEGWAVYTWCWAGLALLESVLLKITVYDGMGFLLVLFVFFYMLMFTLFYFKYVYDRMFEKIENNE
jgi:hypothetical protein